MMSTSGVAGGLAAVVAALLLAAASAVPLRLHQSGDAMLRISFSARPERMETCRRLSSEELADLPQHMRQTVVCEGHSASYRLQVLRDGRTLAESDVHGGGLRRDRQLYVLEEFLIPAGPSTIEILLTRIDSPSPEAEPSVTSGDSTAVVPADLARDAREADERRRRMADEVPAALSLREDVVLAPHEVLLVTYDQAARRLRTVRDSR